MLDEAYKYQLEKIENNYMDRLSIMKCVNGIISIEGNRVYVQNRYFLKIISLFDDWTYDGCKGEFYTIHLIGHKGHMEYTTYCTPQTLELLMRENADNLNEAKKIQPTEKTPKIEPLLSTLLENFFKDVPYPEWMKGEK